MHCQVPEGICKMNTLYILGMNGVFYDGYK